MMSKILLLVTLAVVVVTANEYDFNLPSYLDPCHAAGYSDDAALGDDEALVMKQRLAQQQAERKSKSRSKRGAVSGVMKLWDHAVIPYEIDHGFDGNQRSLFMNAFREWEQVTCLSFVPKEDIHDNWIVIVKGDCGCASFVGNKRLGGQGVSIGRGCDKFGVILHELGHAIGYWHEQSRPDRDKHVKINLDNVAEGRGFNFNRRLDWEVDSLGEAYDFDSIMHYASQQFSKDRKLKTIIPRPDPNLNIGQRVSLSLGDARQTNKLYRCPKCGETLQSSSGTFTTPSKKKRGTTCQWRISVSQGETVTLNITSMFLPKSPNCTQAFVEIRDGYWHKSPFLGRHCGFKTPPPFKSTGHLVWIEFKTLTGIGAVDFSYQSTCGKTLTKEEGVLTTPNYPDYYQSSKDCQWNIKLHKEWKILIRFEVFDIEWSDSCEFDYLEVRDGCQSDAPVLGRFCGDDIPDDVISTGNEVCLSFACDDSVNKQGFVLRYNKVV